MHDTVGCIGTDDLSGQGFEVGNSIFDSDSSGDKLEHLQVIEVVAKNSYVFEGEIKMLQKGPDAQGFGRPFVLDTEPVPFGRIGIFEKVSFYLRSELSV